MNLIWSCGCGKASYSFIHMQLHLRAWDKKEPHRLSWSI